MEDPNAAFVKAPLLGAILSIGVVTAFGAYATIKAYEWGNRDGILMGVMLMVVGVIGARVTSYPRLLVDSKGLTFPRDFVTMKPRHIPWQDILGTDLTLQSAFAYPVLAVNVKGRKEPVGIPFPLVDRDVRQQVLELIQKYVNQNSRCVAT